MNPTAIIVLVLAVLSIGSTQGRTINVHDGLISRPLSYELSEQADELLRRMSTNTTGDSGNCTIRYTLEPITEDDAKPSFYYKATCPTDVNCCGPMGHVEIGTIFNPVIYLATVNGIPTIRAKSVPFGCFCHFSQAAQPVPSVRPMPNQQ